METVGWSPEFYLEEIELRSLREPADTETPGGRPAEPSAETSGGRPAEPSAETSGGRPVEASAETSGGRPAEASAETSGGRPAEASAETSGGRPAEASAETSGGRPTEASAETSGGRPAEASAETSGVQPAEDGHTASPTSQTELTKRTPTWKMVYYGSALILVVTVWTLALLPSVLIFSIVRSPVQVIYMYRPGYHLYHDYVNPHFGVIIVTCHATK